MDARSLVGMTQGARKRAARLNAEGDYVNRGRHDIPSDWHADTPYHEYRRIMRIGQRLRPCPTEWTDHAACLTCDGSGVLPARRAR